MELPVESMIKAAENARECAYAPYSNFKVGAAVLTGSGHIYTGCNVENASFGLTCCAERVAVFKAVSCGERELLALAVSAETEDFCPPCGACRQVLAEFGMGIMVYMANRRGEYIVKSVAELLPHGFGRGALGGRQEGGSCKGDTF